MCTSMVTLHGRRKMVEARAGINPVAKIVGMAFGIGGVDAQGNPIHWNMDEVELRKEILRKPIDNFSKISDTSYRYFVALDENEMAGESISEIGIYDADGDIIALKSFLAKGKDAGIKMNFYIDDQF